MWRYSETQAASIERGGQTNVTRPDKFAAIIAHERR
jgi:hypothetical protein